MGIATSSPAVLCRTTVTYSARSQQAPGGAPTEVTIHDGRRADLPGWSDCGFELRDHRSAVGDWTDDEEIAAVHYAEVEALARELTGCSHALVSDHVRRTAEPTKQRRDQEPVHLVHSDFCAGYDDTVRQIYRNVHGRGAATLARTGVTGADVASADRIVMLNFWRNVGPVRMGLPLAVCDARTVSVDDALAVPYTGYTAGGVTFDFMCILEPERPDEHRWYGFADMTRDEVLAWRSYDTDVVRRGENFFTPHTAYRDPNAAADAPPRTSVELRVMCFDLTR